MKGNEQKYLLFDLNNYNSKNEFRLIRTVYPFGVQYSERDGCTTTALLAGSEGGGCTIVLLEGQLYDCAAGWERGWRLYDCATGWEGDRDGYMTTALLAGSEGGGCKGEGRLYDDCVEKVFTNHLHFDRFDNGTPYFWL